jgi:hypothetical protein
VIVEGVRCKLSDEGEGRDVREEGAAKETEF